MTSYLDLPIGDGTPEPVTAANARFADIENYTEIQPHILLEIAHFFSIYKDLEGKRTEALGWKDRHVAYQGIEAAHTRYRQRHAAA